LSTTKILQGLSSVPPRGRWWREDQGRLAYSPHHLGAFDGFNLPQAETKRKPFFQKSDKPLKRNDSFCVSPKNPWVFLIRSHFAFVVGIDWAHVRA